MMVRYQDPQIDVNFYSLKQGMISYAHKGKFQGSTRETY